MPVAMAPDADAAQDWGQEESDEDEIVPSFGGRRSGCRSMLSGAWRLLLGQSRAIMGPKAAAALAGELLEPVKFPRKKDGKPDPTGTLPHRAIQLKPAALERDLYLSYSWIGHARLSGLCLLVKESGKLIDTLWDGKPGDLRHSGVQVLPLSSFAADCDDAGAFALRLSEVPDSVYSLLFFLTACETKREECGTGFESVYQAEVRLSAGIGEPHVWKYAQNMPQEMANTWLCAMMYRGPFGHWRLEPVSMKFLVVALKDLQQEAGVAEAARNLSWRLKWLAKDRRWAAAESERGLGWMKEED